MEGGQSFICAPRHRVALSFYPPTEPPRGGEASSGSPSAIGLLELSTSEVHAPQCHHVGGGLLHTPSHPYSSSVPQEREGNDGRLFSSALLSSRELLPVKKRITLCCPDFPLSVILTAAIGCPAAPLSGAKVLIYWHSGKRSHPFLPDYSH